MDGVSIDKWKVYGTVSSDGVGGSRGRAYRRGSRTESECLIRLPNTYFFPYVRSSEYTSQPWETGLYRIIWPGSSISNQLDSTTEVHTTVLRNVTLCCRSDSEAHAVQHTEAWKRSGSIRYIIIIIHIIVTGKHPPYTLRWIRVRSLAACVLFLLLRKIRGQHTYARRHYYCLLLWSRAFRKYLALRMLQQLVYYSWRNRRMQRL